MSSAALARSATGRSESASALRHPSADEHIEACNARVGMGVVSMYRSKRPFGADGATAVFMTVRHLSTSHVESSRVSFVPQVAGVRECAAARRIQNFTVLGTLVAKPRIVVAPTCCIRGN